MYVTFSNFVGYKHSAITLKNQTQRASIPTSPQKTQFDLRPELRAFSNDFDCSSNLFIVAYSFQ